MLGGEIKVVMTLDNGQFTIQTQKAGQTIKELRQTIEQTSKSTQALEKHFTGLHGRFRALIQTASLTRYAIHDLHDVFMALPGAVLKTAGDFEKMNLLLQGMSKETTEAGRKLEALTTKNYIIDLALKTPFDIKTITDSFVKFKSAGLDPTNGSMKGLLDSVAKFGGSSEAVHRASIAIQQMAGKGVISMEELRQQLGEAVPNAINMLASGAGVSMAKLTKEVSKGTVEAAGALRTLFTVMQIDNYGASQKMMDSWTGLLSQLKTKLDLFKLDIANAGFFDQMKKQMYDLIDAFDSMEVKSLANDIGQGLTSLVVLTRNLIDFFRNWGSEIVTVGKLFLLYFAGSRLAEGLGAIKKFAESRIQIYRAEIAEAEKANQKRVDTLRREAFEYRARATEQEKFAARNTQIAGQMYAEQARYTNQIAELERRNLGWAGQQKIDRLSARRDEVRAAIVEVQNEAVARRRQAIELRAVADAQERVAAANFAGRVGARADMALIEQANENMRRSVQTLNQKADAATRAATSVGLMGRALAGTKAIFEAFGGWVGIAITVLGFLAEKLYSYMTRWERFRDIVEKTRQGIATKEGVEESKTRIAELEKKIADREKELALGGATVSRMDPTKGRGQSLVTITREQAQRELNQVKGELEDAKRNLREQEVLIQENSDRILAQQLTRQYTRNATKVFEAWKASSEDVEKRKLEALEKAREGGKRLTQEEKEKIEQPFNAEAIESRKNAVRSVQLMLDNEIERLSAELKSATITADRRKEVGVALKVLNDDKLGYRKEIQKLAEDAEASLGKGLGTLKKSPTAKMKEDPLVRMAEDAKAAVEQARIRFKEALQGTREIGDLRNQVALGVLGDAAEGKFDTKTEDAEGNKVPSPLGGDFEKRKFWVENFTKEVVNGKKTINEFIAALKLSVADSKRLIDLISNISERKELDESSKNLQTARDIGVEAAQQLEAAIDELNTNGLAKEDRLLDSVIKRFQKMEPEVRKSAAGYAEFIKMRDRAIADATQARNTRSYLAMVQESKRYVEEIEKDVERSKITRERATMSYLQVAKAVYMEELREFQIKEDKIRQETVDRFRRGEIDNWEYNAELNKISDAGNSYRAEALARFAQNSKSELQKLAESWAQTTNAMNSATANWANQTMDYITKAFNGEKVGRFKDVVVNMLKDLNGILLKKTFGGLIAGGFGEMGKVVSDMLGLGDAAGGGDKPTGKANDPIYVVSAADKASSATPEKKMVDSAKEMWDKVKTGADELWTSVKSSLGSVWDSLSSSFQGLFGANGSLSTALTDLFSGAGDALSGLLGSLTGGGGDLLGSIASFFAFANGGVMSSSGSVPLRKYATGGIANSPQLALFGEGSMNEAYVPLPDGRSIPVSLNGNVAAGTSNMVNINIVVNKDGSESKQSSGDEASQWQRVAQRVRGVVMEELVTQQRPGGVLYK